MTDLDKLLEYCVPRKYRELSKREKIEYLLILSDFLADHPTFPMVAHCALSRQPNNVCWKCGIDCEKCLERNEVSVTPDGAL
jgi:hypothetical protein